MAALPGNPGEVAVWGVDGMGDGVSVVSEPEVSKV